MATCNTEYFIGNGKVFVKPYGTTTQGWLELGDTERMAIEISQEFEDIYESCSGNNNIAAHVVTQTDWNFMVDTLSFSKANLARALYGTASAVAGASVSNENMIFGAVGEIGITKHPDVSAFVLQQASTTLTLDLDYTVDLNTGVVTLISSSNLTGAAPWTLNADYTHGGYDKVAGATGFLTEFSFKFAGINKVTGTYVTVEVPRVALELTEVIEFIGNEKNVFSLGGMVLPDSTAASGDSQYVTIKKVT